MRERPADLGWDSDGGCGSGQGPRGTRVPSAAPAGPSWTGRVSGKEGRSSAVQLLNVRDPK